MADLFTWFLRPGIRKCLATRFCGWVGIKSPLVVVLMNNIYYDSFLCGHNAGELVCPSMYPNIHTTEFE